MPALNDLLVGVATDAQVLRRFRDDPSRVAADFNLNDIEESVLLSRDPKLIQSSLHSAALKGSLAANGDTVWTVIVVL
ncbi:MAG: hypothetical protein AAF376_00920 [Pseudomonadota bacterium]